MRFQNTACHFSNLDIPMHFMSIAKWLSVWRRWFLCNTISHVEQSGSIFFSKRIKKIVMFRSKVHHWNLWTEQLTWLMFTHISIENKKEFCSWKGKLGFGSYFVRKFWRTGRRYFVFVVAILCIFPPNVLTVSYSTFF